MGAATWVLRYGLVSVLGFALGHPTVRDWLEDHVPMPDEQCPQHAAEEHVHPSGAARVVQYGRTDESEFYICQEPDGRLLFHGTRDELPQGMERKGYTILVPATNVEPGVYVGINGTTAYEVTCGKRANQRVRILKDGIETDSEPVRRRCHRTSRHASLFG